MDILEKKKLAQDIKEFISLYAKIRPEYDDEDEKYTSPDAYELIFCAEMLEQDKKLLRFPWSEYSSGGYKRGEEVFEQHQKLLERIKESM